MADDLTMRLRRYMGPLNTRPPICGEAATEIERLRREVLEARRAAALGAVPQAPDGDEVERLRVALTFVTAPAVGPWADVLVAAKAVVAAAVPSAPPQPDGERMATISVEHLNELRAHTDALSRVELWPEHAHGWKARQAAQDAIDAALDPPPPEGDAGLHAVTMALHGAVNPYSSIVGQRTIEAAQQALAAAAGGCDSPAPTAGADEETQS